MKTILYFYLTLFALPLFGQNTLVMGTISNHYPTISNIDLQVNHRYLDGNVNTYESNVLGDGSFAFAINIQEPQTVSLLYARNKALLYLEPNDTLYVNFDAQTFQFSFEFSGRSGKNNAYLNAFLKKNPRELDPFKYLQYRSGAYWYKIDPDMDYAMRSSTKTQFLQAHEKKKAAGLSDLQFYVHNNPSALTDDFVEFMQAELYYDWAYHMLLFGNIYKNQHGLDSSFFEFLNETDIQNDQIGSHWYRMFLMAYLSYQYEQGSTKNENFVLGQYELANKTFSSKAMAFAQSELINTGFYKKYFDATLPLYNEFIRSNAYPQFDEKAINAYQKVIKTAIGTPAPDFDLQDGRRLSSLRGKVVMLNFWATWCRPCLKKMDELKAVQQELGEDIVFIHIGFDKDLMTWENYIQKHNLQGTHLLATAGIHSDLAKQYDVRALPQYFIIDKNGNFAEKPLVFTTENIRTELTYLNR